MIINSLLKPFEEVFLAKSFKTNFNIFYRLRKKIKTFHLLILAI
jgi:hypothetical protein